MLADLNDRFCHTRQFFVMLREVSLHLHDLFAGGQNGEESYGDSIRAKQAYLEPCISCATFLCYGHTCLRVVLRKYYRMRVPNCAPSPPDLALFRIFRGGYWVSLSLHQLPQIV